MEDLAIEMARQRQAATTGMEEMKRRSDEEATEQAAVEAALRASREDFDSFTDLETALELSAQAEIQAELIRSATEQSEAELMKKVMEDSLKDDGIKVRTRHEGRIWGHMLPAVSGGRVHDVECVMLSLDRMESLMEMDMLLWGGFLSDLPCLCVCEQLPTVDDEIMQAVIESSKAEFQAVGGKGVVVDEEEEVKKAMQMSIADSGEYPQARNSSGYCTNTEERL